MKRLALIVAIVVCLPAAAAARHYTLVLGLSAPGGDLLGYRDYAQLRCPTELPCLTYFDLYDAEKCRGFYDCVTQMMDEATYIVFLVDKPSGQLTEEDVLCDVEDPAQPDDGQYTPLELCIITHCPLLHDKTYWWCQRDDALTATTLSLSAETHCRSGAR